MITITIMIGLGLIFYARFRKANLTMESISLSYLFGFIILTSILFVLTVFDIRLNKTILLFLFSLVTLSFVFLYKNRISFNKLIKFKSKKLDTYSIISLIIVIYFALSSLAYNFYWPVISWDALALYDARAVVYASGGLLKDLWQQTSEQMYYYGYYFNSYPPSTSLAHASIYILKENGIQIFYSLFYISLLYTFYIRLSENIEKKIAIAMTVLLSVSQLMVVGSVMAYTNLPYLTYFCLSILYLDRWQKYANNQDIFISIMLVCSSILIRALEPLFLINIFLLFVMSVQKTVIEKKKYFFVIFIIISLTPILLRQSWFWYVRNNITLYGGVPGNPLDIKYLIQTLSNVGIDRFVEIIKFLIQTSSTYNYLIYPFLISILLRPKLLLKNYVIGFSVLGTLGYYVFGAFLLEGLIGKVENVADSVSRSLMVLCPLILMYLGIFINDVKKEYFFTKK